MKSRAATLRRNHDLFAYRNVGARKVTRSVSPDSAGWDMAVQYLVKLGAEPYSDVTGKTCGCRT